MISHACGRTYMYNGISIDNRAHHIERVYMFSLLEFLTTNPPSLPWVEMKMYMSLLSLSLSLTHTHTHTVPPSLPLTFSSLFISLLLLSHPSCPHQPLFLPLSLPPFSLSPLFNTSRHAHLHPPTYIHPPSKMPHTLYTVYNHDMH